MRIRAELENQGPITVTIDSRDVRAWERWSNESWLSADVSVSQITYAAWHAAKRTGAFAHDWMVFDASCVAVDIEEDAETNPTPQAVGDDSSSNSPSEQASL